MKKSFSKILSLMLVFVLAMSMMACGSTKKSESKEGSVKASKDMTLEEVYEKMTEASKDVEGLKASAKVSGDISYAGEEMGMSADMDMEVDSKDMEHPDLHINADYTVNYMGQNVSLSMEMYELMDSDVVKMYMNMYNQWVYQETEMSDMEDEMGIDMSSLSEMMEDVDYSEIFELFDEAEIEAKGTNYVMTFKLTSDGVMSLLSEYGLDEYISEYESMIPDAELNITVVVDAGTFLPKSMEMKFDMDDLEIEGEKISVSDVSMTINYKDYGKVSIKVPEDALAAEED